MKVFLIAGVSAGAGLTAMILTKDYGNTVKMISTFVSSGLGAKVTSVLLDMIPEKEVDYKMTLEAPIEPFTSEKDSTLITELDLNCKEKGDDELGKQ
jgi:hypothetical protein